MKPILFALLALSACATTQTSAPPTFDVQIPHAMLATDAVRIYTDDNSIEMTPGRLVPVTEWQADAALPTPDAYPKEGLRVRIAIPGYQEPLYGILVFHRIARGTLGAHARAYAIRVPDADVEATANGIRVVYDKYRVASQMYPTWVLWLSRGPFPPKS